MSSSSPIPKEEDEADGFKTSFPAVAVEISSFEQTTVMASHEINEKREQQEQQEQQQLDATAPARNAAGVGRDDDLGDKDGALQRSDESVSTACNEDQRQVAGGDASQDARPENDGHSKLPYSKARCIALVATVTGAAFNNTFSAQAVVIVLPTIGRELNIPDSRLQWVVSAYSLAFGCFLLFWGRVADIYGKKTMFICGSAWFTITSVINPFVPNEIAFDLLRGLSGLGAAANVPTALGILGVTFPPGKAKNFAFAAYGAGAPLGSILGNLLAGVIASYASWKWVFGFMAIMSGIATVLGYLIIPAPKHTPHDEGVTAKSTVDWVGAFLVTVGLFGLLFALTEGNVVGWATPWIPVLIVVSCLLIAAFVWWQHRLEKGGLKAPLVKVSFFRSMRFSAAMLIMAFSFASFNGFLVYATYFYQSYQGRDALQTTLRFIPTGVVGCATAFVTAHLLHRVPTWTILGFGTVAVSLCNLLFAVPIPPTTSYWAYGLEAMSLSVIGVDTAWPSLLLFTSAALPQSDQALGGALVNAVGQVGRSIGLAIATAIQTTVMARARGVTVEDVGPVLPWDGPSLEGLRSATWFHFALGVLSTLVVVVFFRGSGVIGKAQPAKEKDAVVAPQQRDEEEAAVPAAGRR